MNKKRKEKKERAQGVELTLMRSLMNPCREQLLPVSKVNRTTQGSPKHRSSKGKQQWGNVVVDWRSIRECTIGTDELCTYINRPRIQCIFSVTNSPIVRSSLPFLCHILSYRFRQPFVHRSAACDEN